MTQDDWSIGNHELRPSLIKSVVQPIAEVHEYVRWVVVVQFILVSSHSTSRPQHGGWKWHSCRHGARSSCWYSRFSVLTPIQGWKILRTSHYFRKYRKCPIYSRLKISYICHRQFMAVWKIYVHLDSCIAEDVVRLVRLGIRGIGPAGFSGRVFVCHQRIVWLLLCVCVCVCDRVGNWWWCLTLVQWHQITVWQWQHPWHRSGLPSHRPSSLASPRHQQFTGISFVRFSYFCSL